jgi:hypothetical protein
MEHNITSLSNFANLEFLSDVQILNPYNDKTIK